MERLIDLLKRSVVKKKESQNENVDDSLRFKKALKKSIIRLKTSKNTSLNRIFKNL
jgi:hypothetical protein